MSFFWWHGLAESQVTRGSQQWPPASSPWTDGWLRKGPSCLGQPQSHLGPRGSDPTTPSAPSLCASRGWDSTSSLPRRQDALETVEFSHDAPISSLILFPQFSNFICQSIKKKKKKTIIKLKINVLTTRILFEDVSELIRIKSYLKWDMMDSSIL